MSFMRDATPRKRRRKAPRQEASDYPWLDAISLRIPAVWFTEDMRAKAAAEFARLPSVVFNNHSRAEFYLKQLASRNMKLPISRRSGADWLVSTIGPRLPPAEFARE